MRATTLLNFLLRLPGTFACDAGRWRLDSGDGDALVTVRLSRKLLVCPLCTFSTPHRYDTREVDSSWRHLDPGRAGVPGAGAAPAAAVPGAWRAR